MKKSIFERLLAGESIHHTDPDFVQIHSACAHTATLLMKYNAESDEHRSRELLHQILGNEVGSNTFVGKPLHLNYGGNIKIGQGVYININCTMLGLGGITIEDGVLIAPSVNISSEGHPTSPSERGHLWGKPVRICSGAWVGMGANILPGVTIGRNAVVAAGAVVTHDVPDGAVVAGVPAQVIRLLEE